jgi:hypothetical protein
MHKYIHIKRELKPMETRKVMKDSMFKISIPTDWARYFQIQKGQLVDLVLTQKGFEVKIIG